MLFKQLQIFPIEKSIPSSANILAERLLPFSFKPCLPSMPSSMGWISPIDEDDAPLTRGLNGCFMLTLQIEEKILPGSVVTHTLKEKIKQIELNEARKVRGKEKLSFKDEVMMTLLPRAFSKYTRLSAYIDTRNHWLILNTTSPAKTELFISMFKKAFGDGAVGAFDITKPSAIVTNWLKNKNYPQSFSIEKQCVLQDPNQQTRLIRCQEQDLFASSIQSFVKDGCEAIQIGLCWQDRLNFVIADDFSLRSIREVQDDIMEIKDELETKQQKFDADLIMMIETFTGFFQDLLGIFTKNNEASRQDVKMAIAV